MYRKQTLVLGDPFCCVKITVCYRLDDHDFSSAGAQSRAVLLLQSKARSLRSSHRSQLAWLGSLLVMTEFVSP